MTANAIETIISHMLLGTATTDELQSLEAWAASDEHHRRLLARFLSRHDLADTYHLPAGAAPTADAPDGSEKPTDDAPDGSEKPTDEPHRPWARRVALWVAAAAAAIILVAGFYRYYHADAIAPEMSQRTIAAISQAIHAGRNNASVAIVRQGSTTTAGRITATSDSVLTTYADDLVRQADASRDDLAAVVTTHHDKEFWLTLPDGTVVHLNYNSTLTYPLAFTGSRREVSLEGEAYFFVAHQEHRPFVVHTRQGDVRDYGTEFNICTNGGLMTRKNELGVVLISGSAGVSNGRQEVRLRPGRMAIVRPDGTTTVHTVDTAPYTAWNNGTFSFDNCTMDRLMDVVGHWYGMQVVYSDPAVRDVTFTGDLDRYGTDIDEVLRAIAAATDVSLHRNGRTIVVDMQSN